MGLDAEIVLQVPHLMTDAEVRDLAVQFGLRFHDEVWVRRPSYQSRSGERALVVLRRDDENRGCLTKHVPKVPHVPETLLEVSTAMRYYGPGYERGPLVVILAMASYLGRFGTVYYGSDGDARLRALDAEYRDELWQHFVGPDGLAYRFGSRWDPAQLICDWCQIRMADVMSRGSDRGYVCLSCDYRCVRFADGRTVECDDEWAEKYVIPF